MDNKFTDEEVLAELQRIVDSRMFNKAKRLREFISYVVFETLAGQTRNLSGYAISLGVFDRSPGFDPQSDTLVRVTANKLRLKLENYYHGEGRNNPLRITLPLGGYKVAIEDAEPMPGAGGSYVPAHPVLLIESFDCLSYDPEHYAFCHGLFSEVCLSLASLRRFMLVAPPPLAEVNDVARYNMRKHDEADLLLSCNLRWTDSHVRVVAQLVEAKTRCVAWIGAKDFAVDDGSIVKLQKQISGFLSDELENMDPLPLEQCMAEKERIIKHAAAACRA